MKVSLNLTNNLYQNRTFGTVSKEYQEHAEELRKNKAITAKTKKTVSECATVAVAASVFYFIMKRNFKMNAIKSAEEQMTKLANMPKLNWEPHPGNIVNIS